jgi:hypothetical protein
VAVSAWGYATPRLRNVEDELPDAVGETPPVSGSAPPPLPAPARRAEPPPEQAAAGEAPASA